MSKIAKLHIYGGSFHHTIYVGKKRTFCKYIYPAYNLCSAILFGYVILGRCRIVSNTRGYLVAGYMETRTRKTLQLNAYHG